MREWLEMTKEKAIYSTHSVKRQFDLMPYWLRHWLEGFLRMVDLLLTVRYATTKVALAETVLVGSQPPKKKHLKLIILWTGGCQLTPLAMTGASVP